MKYKLIQLDWLSFSQTLGTEISAGLDLRLLICINYTLSILRAFPLLSNGDLNYKVFLPPQHGQGFTVMTSLIIFSLLLLKLATNLLFQKTSTYPFPLLEFTFDQSNESSYIPGAKSTICLKTWLGLSPILIVWESQLLLYNFPGPI